MTPDPRVRAVGEIEAAHLFDMVVDLNPRLDIGGPQMTYGGRWVIPGDVQAGLADPASRHQVDPARYYFRRNPLFETGAAPYAWLNDIVCVGTGYLVDGGIAYKVARVL